MPKEIALHPPALAAGVSAWCALRVGSFRFSCRWNWIFGNKTSDHTCCACRCSNEDTDHLLWYCKAWKRHRRHFVASLALLVGESKWESLPMERKTLIALGGLSDLTSKVALACGIASVHFLNRVSRIRDIFVANWGTRLREAATA